MLEKAPRNGAGNDAVGWAGRHLAVFENGDKVFIDKGSLARGG
ncbi:MAG: hypothetical protein ACPIOQ_09760 [Promethearchaeia archaeon]